MQKCPKCLKVFEDHLNFCQACGSMLEKVVEESLQAAEIHIKDEKPKAISTPIFSGDLSEPKHPPAHLKEMVSTLFYELADAMFDRQMRIDAGADSELTLLNLHGRSMQPDKPRGQCPACGSTKVIMNLPVRCKNPDWEGNLSFYIDAAPDGFILKEPRDFGLLADVCGDCGHVEFKLQNARNLYDQHLRSEKAHSDA